MLKAIPALEATALLAVAVAIGAWIFTGVEQPIAKEPAPEAEEEPAILTPPAEEAEPEPTELPEGVICMEDCPLIDPATVEAEVRRYFADVPIMIEIAKCESTFRQFDEQGKPLKNPNSSATGVMQLMASYHREPAKNMGLDIDTLEGNLGYARVLFEQQGTTPWNASAYCWYKYYAYAR